MGTAGGKIQGRALPRVRPYHRPCPASSPPCHRVEDSCQTTRVLGWCCWSGVAARGCLRRGQVRGRQCSGGRFFSFIQTVQRPVFTPCKEDDFANIICNEYQIPLPCPRQIPCPSPRLPRVESPRALSCPKVECPRVECPRVTDIPAGSDLPPAKKCRGDASLVAAYAVGAFMGGVSTWHTVKAMD